jgi:hypothetical protein
MRPRVLRRWLILAWFGAILGGLVLGTGIGAAHASDPGDMPEQPLNPLQYGALLAADLILSGIVIIAIIVGLLWLWDRFIRRDRTR